VILPEGITRITAPIRLAPGDVLRGQGRGLSILEILTPSSYGVILDGHAPSELPTRNMVEGLTIRTYQPNVTGIRLTAASANTIKDVGFQGPSTTIQVDRGLHNVIDTVYVEPFEGLACGTLRVGSLDPAWYSHYTTIRAYQTRGQGSGWIAIFDRATNINADIMVHDPGCNGILINGDCQGLMLAGWIVAAPTGVMLNTAGSVAPSFVDLTRLHIDQSRDFAVQLLRATDVDVGGQITNGGQGILINSYPYVERIRINGRLAGHHDNGIVALPGARYFSVDGTYISGCMNGVAVVVSNLQGDQLSVVNNDFSQGNRGGYVGPPSGPTRIIQGNR